MRLLAVLISTALTLGVVACGTSDFSDPDECDLPVLAAGEELPLALSCAEGVIYEGTDYLVGCAPLHPSRVGKVFLRDGGETRFTAARDVYGMRRADVILLEDDSQHQCGRHKELIGASESFSRFDAGRLRVPVGVANQERVARKRAPWIIPGRHEVPRALRLHAALSEDGITVTNRNKFTWRNCDQIQINDQVESVWETGDYLTALKPGASYTWPLKAFGRDHHELESLSDDATDQIRGKPFIIMCRAPRGPAFGRAIL